MVTVLLCCCAFCYGCGFVYTVVVVVMVVVVLMLAAVIVRVTGLEECTGHILIRRSGHAL